MVLFITAGVACVQNAVVVGKVGDGEDGIRSRLGESLCLPAGNRKLKALKMPLSFEENRILFPSAENDAPLTVVVAVNCSIEYCLSGRWPAGTLLASLAAPGPALRATKVKSIVRSFVQCMAAPCRFVVK